MKIALLLSACILAWYLIGFLTVCIGNFFDGPFGHEEWLEERGFLYRLAFLGPLVTLVVIVWFFISTIKGVGTLLNAQKVFPLVVRISDWMIAGFRKPPIPPVAKDEASDLPTVSP